MKWRNEPAYPLLSPLERGVREADGVCYPNLIYPLDEVLFCVL